MRRPKVQKSVPGPKAKTVLERSEKYGSLPATRAYPLVVEQAAGCWVTDPDGNEFLDMTAGGGVALAGHAHPDICQAMAEQCKRLVHHAPSHVNDPNQVELAKRLSELVPVRGEEPRAYLGTSGTAAVRAAIELVRHHSGRETIIAFTHTMQGPDLEGVGVSRSKVIEDAGLGPLVSGVFNTAYPDPLRHEDEAIANALEQILMILGKLTSPDSVAALMVEPMQKDGGFLVPPAGFFAALRRLCDQHGMLLIVNEVHTGLGRTGKMLGWQHSEVEPDLVCLAGGLGGGLPLGAVVARGELMDWPDNTRPSIFGGNPVGCAAALKLLDLLEGGLIARAGTLGDKLEERLSDAVGKHDAVGEVRGRGLLCAVELVKDRDALEAATELRAQVLQACFEKGLLLAACGPSTLAFCPALTVSEDELAVAVEIFAEVLAEASAD